jgi:hypothetical protein
MAGGKRSARPVYPRKSANNTVTRGVRTLAVRAPRFTVIEPAARNFGGLVTMVQALRVVM